MSCLSMARLLTVKDEGNLLQLDVTFPLFLQRKEKVSLRWEYIYIILSRPAPGTDSYLP